MQVNYGERVALVGPNGAGKSTLFSIILKEEDPDAGTVERDEWTMIGYLPQEGEAVGSRDRAGCGHRPRGRTAARWRRGCTSSKRPAMCRGPEYWKRTRSTRR